MGSMSSLENYAAVDARFNDVNNRFNSIDKSIIQISESVGQHGRSIQTLIKENDLFREAKHAHGNMLNLHQRDLEMHSEQYKDMSNAIKELSGKIGQFIKFSYIITGMGMVLASTLFYKIWTGGI